MEFEWSEAKRLAVLEARRLDFLGGRRLINKKPIDWTRAVKGIPPPKRDIHIRLDEDVLDWFKQAGRGYQTRINNVLRAFMESRKRAPLAGAPTASSA